jgi:glycine/D-amino acid oxidase-like deaminating enzyme
VDGGYYCKTPENLPLVGPYKCDTVTAGYYVCGATSGYGVMVAQVGIGVRFPYTIIRRE